MATKEHKPVGPKQRKAIKFSDSLVEVAYVCESCGTEIKRTIRPPNSQSCGNDRCPVSGLDEQIMFMTRTKRFLNQGTTVMNRVTLQSPWQP